MTKEEALDRLKGVRHIASVLHQPVYMGLLDVEALSLAIKALEKSSGKGKDKFSEPVWNKALMHDMCNDEYAWQCSNCGGIASRKHQYCPHCKKRMNINA